jgi:hypothetical protein
MNTRIILPLILLTLAQDISSQVFRRFSTDHEKYPGELALFMGESMTENEAADLYEYSEKWTTGAFPDTVKSYIIAVSNFMLAKNARPKPHYILFINTLNKLDENIQDSLSSYNWQYAF